MRPHLPLRRCRATTAGPAVFLSQWLLGILALLPLGCADSVAGASRQVTLHIYAAPCTGPTVVVTRRWTADDRPHAAPGAGTTVAQPLRGVRVSCEASSCTRIRDTSDGTYAVTVATAGPDQADIHLERVGFEPIVVRVPLTRGLRQTADFIVLMKRDQPSPAVAP